MQPDTSPRYGVYPLTEADRNDFTAHMLRLDPASRYQRFNASLPDAAVIRACAHLALDKGAAGLFVWGELKGAVIVVAYPNDPLRGELAVTLATSLRGRGWGQFLVESALKSAYLAGLSHVDVHYISENTAMSRICRQFPGESIREGSSFQKIVDLEAWMEAELLACATP